MPELTVPDYIAHLKHESAEVRRNAAWNLGRFRDITLIEPLLDALQDTDPSVRLRVVESLGNFRDGRVVLALIQALESDTDSEVQARIAAALGNQSDPAARAPLLNALTSESPLVRTMTAEALGALGDAATIPALVKTMFYDADGDVRFTASRSLIRIGGAAVVDVLIASLDDTRTDVHKLYIAEILGMLQDKRAADALRTLEDDADAEIRETARWALNRLR